MEKQFLQTLVSYNVWANERIISTLTQFSDDLLNKELSNSFNTIRKTVYHIWDAQVIWLNRINGISLQDWPSKTYENFQEHYFAHFIDQSKEFEKFIHSKTEMYFKTSIKYETLKGEKYENKVWEIVIHCMNHSTYHRGQLITMLHQIGIKNLISTDIIFYLRENI